MGSARSVLSDVSLHLVDSLDEALALRSWLGERREILAVDTESGGLSPWKDELRLVQLGDMRAGWAIPWPLWGGLVQELLRRYDGDIVLHNLPHDVKFLKVRGEIDLPWSRLHDTLLLAALDDPMRPRGLKPLSKKLVDPAADAGEQALSAGMKKQGWTWATVPYNFAPYWVYSAADPVLTAWLYHYLAPRVQGDCPDAYDVERGINRICTAMMLKGMRIDREYILRATARLDDYYEKATGWLSQVHGIDSLYSAKKIAQALAENGEPPVRMTATGLPQVDKEFLGRVKEHGSTLAARQIAEQVLGARHAAKMKSAYLDNFIESADADDIVRCHIWQAQAVTGRMSITEPALQTLSRDDTFIRGSFIPREGHVFISADYSQVEARIAAHFANDQGMIEAFEIADGGGPDFFATIASQIFRRAISKKDPERQLTKNVVYGACYGAGVEKMAHTAGVSVEMMRPVKQQFDERFPGLRRFTAECVREARQTAQRDGRPAVRSGMGRYLPVEPSKEYVSVNRKIQAEAAEVLKRAMLDLDAAGLGDAMILPIHDEVLFEVPKDDAEEARKLIEETMTVRDRYCVPLTCSGVVMQERWQKE